MALSNEAKRTFNGHFVYGEWHLFVNRLDGVGASTTVHAHEFPHISQMWPGEDGQNEYLVEAMLDDGTTREIKAAPWGLVCIGAHVAHRITLVKGSVGMFACWWCMYGPDGKRRDDPKVASEVKLGDDIWGVLVRENQLKVAS